MEKNVPEGQISPQTLQQVAPDVASPSGQQQLFTKAVKAHVAKKQLDAIMQAVATHLGATTNSRVKNIETASNKIVQKRLQGRNEYNIDSVNDMLGTRIILKNKGDFPKAKQVLEKLADAGVFTINKQQPVKKGSYDAYHMDVTMGNGTDAEIQLHTPQSEAEAMVNHSMRSQYGEKPNDPNVEALKEKQAGIVKTMPNDKAKAVTDALQQMMQQQKGQVLPQQSAQLLAGVK